MGEISLYIFYLITLVIMSAYFSASETSFSSVKIVRLEDMLSRKKKKLNHYSLKLTKDFTSTLSIILILNNIVNLTAASISILLFTKLGTGNEVLLSTIFITFVILIFGEFLPKVFANRHPEFFAIYFGLPLYLITKLFIPITKIISLFIKNENKKTTTEKELIRTLQKIEEAGELEKEESSLIKSALNFDDKTVKSIFTKWKDVITLEYTWTIEEALKIITEQKHTRMPVIKNSKVVGFVSIVDLFGHSKKAPIANFVRPVQFISQNIHLDDALEKMQQYQQHILIITKYQKTTNPIGIITMEDLIEEIIGEIYDETDDTPLVMEIGHHGHAISGKAIVKEVFTDLNATMPLVNDITFYEWVLLSLNKDGKSTLDKFKPFKYDRYEIRIIEEKGVESIFQLIEK